MAEDYRNDVQNRGKENPEKELVLLDLTHKKRNSAQHSAQTSARRRSVQQTEEIVPRRGGNCRQEARTHSVRQEEGHTVRRTQNRQNEVHRSSLQQTLEEDEEARRRAMARARQRRNKKRIQQRNRRFAAAILVVVVLIGAGITGVVRANKKAREEKAQQVYAEQEAKKKAQEQEKEKDAGIKTAEESEKNKWYLRLVNAKNSLDKDNLPEINTVSVNGSDYVVDERIIDDLEEMLSDAQSDGRYPVVCSAYRSWDTQEMLFENKIARVKQSKGLTGEAAEIEAATVVARPGTSEHQLGLAVDITASDYTNLDEGQMETEDQQWLMENCWKYGFILRYPVDKTEITGVIFEPWHYRYVGKEAAKEITEQGITLEEYLEAEAVGDPRKE